MHVLMAGATGLIGRAVQRRLMQAGHQVRLLVRRPATGDEFSWDPVAGRLPVEAMTWADAVISLNGASLTRLPWTPAYRRQIVESRTIPTALIARTILDAPRPPAVWISASATGIYGHRPGQPMTEDSPPGTGFLADVVAAWEAAARPAGSVTRLVFARTGMVLGPGGLTPLMTLARCGLAGRIGSGRQHWPWVSLDDEAAAICHLATASTLAGPVNLVSPVPATADDVTRAITAALRRPHVVPAPAWALRTVLGDAARDLLLADQLVLPDRLASDPTFSFAATDLRAVAASMAAHDDGPTRTHQ